jgi:hypothetical protein
MGREGGPGAEVERDGAGQGGDGHSLGWGCRAYEEDERGVGQGVEGVSGARGSRTAMVGCEEVPRKGSAWTWDERLLRVIACSQTVDGSRCAGGRRGVTGCRDKRP